MRKVWIVLLLVLLVSAALVVPAAAKKPAPSPVYYEVTMGFDGNSDGLATTCEAGSIRMLHDSAHGVLTATGGDDTEVARLFVRLGIPWVREYPYDLGPSGTGFNECHGGETSTSSGTWGGNLMIFIDSAGNPTQVLWHFDHYVEQTVVRKRVVTSFLEGFTLSSGDTLTYDTTTHIASGTFALFRWDPSILPDPYELQGTSPFSFTLTVSPAA